MRPGRWMALLEKLWEVFAALPLAYLWVRLFAWAGTPGGVAIAAGVVPLLAGGAYVRRRTLGRHRMLLRYPWVLWSRHRRVGRAALLGLARSYPIAAVMALVVLGAGPGLEGFSSEPAAVGTFLLLAVVAWLLGEGTGRLAALRQPVTGKGRRRTGG